MSIFSDFAAALRTILEDTNMKLSDIVLRVIKPTGKVQIFLTAAIYTCMGRPRQQILAHELLF